MFQVSNFNKHIYTLVTILFFANMISNPFLQYLLTRKGIIVSESLTTFSNSSKAVEWQISRDLGSQEP